MIASNTRGPGFVSKHQQFLLWTLFTAECKIENTKRAKREENGPFWKGLILRGYNLEPTLYLLLMWLGILVVIDVGFGRFIFFFFKHKFYRKNCVLQRDSNSDRWSERLTNWRPPRPLSNICSRNLFNNYFSDLKIEQTCCIYLGRKELEPVSSIWNKRRIPVNQRQRREMEYIEQASSNTFYPFQNKHKIHWHLQIAKMLCPLNVKI